MPYVIEHNRRIYLPTDPGASPMWRDEPGESTSVATIDEAITEAADILSRSPLWDDPTDEDQGAEYREYAAEIQSIDERGGAIGPLPDGTTINIERVEWHELWHRAHSGKGPRDWMHIPFDDILGIYNAQHERA